MDALRFERKLVAILAADVVGYSRHMEQDEVSTLATLSRHGNVGGTHRDNGFTSR
jgi:class 3 adenylate cyclase